ncbi:MAG: VTT domain-containing protein [Bacteroidetes bacterium]|nr:VTT domain-containing protein [Bacteroidota bacterium]MDA1121855.1 VTT domain-containing protein [Bacteroidota bacterium]
MRLFILFIILAVLVLIPFFIWGDALMTAFSEKGTITFLTQYGQWAWAVAILLLMADLFLPIPATIIMAAVGYIYGPVAGGIISAAGSFMGGVLGHGLCRIMGEKTARRILGEKDYERGVRLSGDIGGWLVVLSRWLPVFPEVVSCMAGLIRMRLVRFILAMACGSLPLGFTYAYIGHAGVDNPYLAVGLSAGLPPLIWLSIRPVFQKKWGKA